MGQIGEIVNVKTGHARNFLIKFGKALIASKENIDIVSKKKAELNEKNIEFKRSAKKIHDLINNANFKFSKRAKENDELYGSIKPLELSKTITESSKVEVKPSQIDLSSEINKIGSYQVKINLHAEVLATIHIEVVKQEEKK